MFFTLYVILYITFRFCNPPFKVMKTFDRQEYLSRYTGILHAVTVVIIAYLAMFKLCDDPTVSVYTSTECILKPRKLNYYSVQFSLGFFLYDFLLCFLLMRDFSALGIQMLFHHIAAILSFTYVLLNNPHWTMYIVTMNQFTEISATGVE